MKVLSWLSAAPFAVALLAFSGCTNTVPASRSVYQNERFQPDETFSRLIDGSVEASCEAARRALLSQGYVITAAGRDLVNGRKHFQPNGEVHIEIAFTVVCIAEGKSGQAATAFVSAVQDRYALKKSPNSASVGLSAIGSISVPLTATDDSLVKVASETIPAGEFYDRFFTLMQRFLREGADPHADDAAADTASLPARP
jgi:hypothetical protein